MLTTFMNTTTIGSLVSAHLSDNDGGKWHCFSNCLPNLLFFVTDDDSLIENDDVDNFVDTGGDDDRTVDDDLIVDDTPELNVINGDDDDSTATTLPELNAITPTTPPVPTPQEEDDVDGVFTVESEGIYLNIDPLDDDDEDPAKDDNESEFVAMDPPSDSRPAPTPIPTRRPELRPAPTPNPTRRPGFRPAPTPIPTRRPELRPAPTPNPTRRPGFRPAPTPNPTRGRPELRPQEEEYDDDSLFTTPVVSQTYIVETPDGPRTVFVLSNQN